MSACMGLLWKMGRSWKNVVARARGKAGGEIASLYLYTVVLVMRASLSPLTSNPTALPYLGSVSCGFPSPAADYQQPDLSLDQLVGLTPTSSLFLFRAQGHSMSGIGIYDGDVLIVDRARQARKGSIVLAVVGPEFLVKRLSEHEDGRVMLVAENPAYPPMILNEDEPLEIWGVCVSNLHNLVGV
jgi:DNA polymerase V